MKVTVFYSWQSDLPNSTNRGFIQQALEKAVALIKSQQDLIIEPCVERDTSGVTGTPDISATIFGKIDEAHIFVGDVSFIGELSSLNPVKNDNPEPNYEAENEKPKRKTPNPNVMLELGYAVKCLNWENVICVFNTAYGKIEELPFDLRHRRIVPYDVTKEQVDKAHARNNLAKSLQQLIQPIFSKLNQQVIEESTPKPVTPELAASQIKKMLPKASDRIQLRDYVSRHASELQQRIGAEFPVHLTSNDAEVEIRLQIESYTEIVKVATAIIIAGCYYGDEQQQKLWIELLERVADTQNEMSGNTVLFNLRRLPALILLYAGGIAALSGEHYDLALALFTKPRVANRIDSDPKLLSVLSTHRVIETDIFNRIMGTRRYTPLSDYLCNILRDPLSSILPNIREYERCFDRFEYLKCLLEVHETSRVRAIGCFGWRYRSSHDVMKEINMEESRDKKRWPFYLAGWFDGQVQRFNEAKSQVYKVIEAKGWD